MAANQQEQQRIRVAAGARINGQYRGGADPRLQQAALRQGKGK